MIGAFASGKTRGGGVCVNMNDRWCTTNNTHVSKTLQTLSSNAYNIEGKGAYDHKQEEDNEYDSGDGLENDDDDDVDDEDDVDDDDDGDDDYDDDDDDNDQMMMMMMAMMVMMLMMMIIVIITIVIFILS
ncbi:hypothetical protein ElyMa_002902700 [Elysia marginata]|uniref:Uncharacterized protein n=1 Tax=Elysia marginata TaxID=1093978 RepID=A0AAV4I4W6_9GAST|nr:hypothetical protein ElyMa_002902700 [Elysia marginata]